ncbi:hypothetical protein [Clostridium sp.]|uniref:hypothetical protein n=1 Tax=Clostridium sp. TaxID=1506 RepID=UPI003D6D09C7
MEGLDKDGYNKRGFNKHGYNVRGYDKSGHDIVGYNKDGFDRTGYNKLGYDLEGYNTLGYSRDGYKKIGYNNVKVNTKHIAKLTKTTNLGVSNSNIINNVLEDSFMKLKSFENKEFILTALNMIKGNSEILDGVIGYLITKKYCKNTFELQFELLREIKPEFTSDQIRRLHYDNANCIHLRYYKKDIFVYKDKNYIVCNHWFDIQRDKFIRWAIEEFA